MRRRQVAAQIRAAARDWADTDDEDLKKVHASDARDLMKVAQLVDAGRIQQARDACSMDTVVRDQLPRSFFDLLERHGVAW